MPRGPTAAQHYAWAQQNEAFYDTIGRSHSPNPDWAITVLFYAAVHATQAALIKDGIRPRDHESRKEALRLRWSPLANLYESLYGLSRQARYECIRHSQMQVALAEASLGMVHSEIARFSGPPY